MKKVTKIELSEKEILDILKEKLQITGDLEFYWKLKNKPRGRYDDIRDPTGQTVETLFISIKTTD